MRSSRRCTPATDGGALESFTPSLPVAAYTPGGYGGALEKLLAPAGIYAQHAGGEYGGGQCGDTRLGLVCSDTTDASVGGGYLNVPGTFDLISFNYGLHGAPVAEAVATRLA